MYDSILFDLDGTLWDATHVTAKIWPTVLARHPEVHRSITEADVQAHMGRTNEELASLLFPDLPYDKAYGLMMESCAVENELLRTNGGRLYPDIPRVLAALTVEYPLFIVSNCQAGYIEAFLSYHRLGKYFRDHISSGDTGKKRRTISGFCGIGTICNPRSTLATRGLTKKPPVRPAAISAT